jgi:hypothetical protein
MRVPFVRGVWGWVDEQSPRTAEGLPRRPNDSVGPGDIGTAVLPPCDDTPNDGDPGAATSVRAYRVVGWDPGKAIAVGTSPGDAVFVRVTAG